MDKFLLHTFPEEAKFSTQSWDDLINTSMKKGQCKHTSFRHLYIIGGGQMSSWDYPNLNMSACVLKHNHD